MNADKRPFLIKLGHSAKLAKIDILKFSPQ